MPRHPSFLLKIKITMLDNSPSLFLSLSLSDCSRGCAHPIEQSYREREREREKERERERERNREREREREREKERGREREKAESAGVL